MLLPISNGIMAAPVNAVPAAIEVTVATSQGAVIALISPVLMPDIQGSTNAFCFSGSWTRST
jgi:hypothetical protein